MWAHLIRYVQGSGSGTAPPHLPNSGTPLPTTNPMEVSETRRYTWMRRPRAAPGTVCGVWRGTVYEPGCARTAVCRLGADPHACHVRRSQSLKAGLIVHAHDTCVTQLPMQKPRRRARVPLRLRTRGMYIDARAYVFRAEGKGDHIIVAARIDIPSRAGRGPCHGSASKPTEKRAARTIGTDSLSCQQLRQPTGNGQLGYMCGIMATAISEMQLDGEGNTLLPPLHDATGRCVPLQFLAASA